MFRESVVKDFPGIGDALYRKVNYEEDII